MRKLILGGATAALALTLSTVALGGLVQIAHIVLTATRAGAPTGVRLTLETIDAGALKPPAISKVVVSFPKGTSFNLHTPTLRTCAVPDTQLKDQFGQKCPGGSLIASGKSTLNVFPLPSGLTKTPYEVPATVKAYMGRGSMILVVAPTVVAYKSMISVLHATVAGSALTLKVPKLVWGANPKSKPPFPGIRLVLVHLQLAIPAIGRGSAALMTAGRCTSRKFVVSTRFAYADGSRMTRISSSRCK